MTHEETSLQRKFESIAKHAHRTWTKMRNEVADYGPAMQVGKLGRGRIVKTSIAPFVRKVSQEVTGHDCDENRVELVRKFLRYTHNVVTMGSTNEKYTYEIFVRDEWNDFDAVMPMVFGADGREQQGNWYERKVTAEEAGETRAQEPVDVQYQCRHCPDRFSTTIELATHTAAKHTPRPAVRCPKCEREFKNSSGLGRHEKACKGKDKEEQVSEVGDKVYTCEEHNFVTTNRFQYSGHISARHGRGYQCKHCPEKVYRLHDMAVHVLDNHPEVTPAKRKKTQEKAPVSEPETKPTKKPLGPQLHLTDEQIIEELRERLAKVSQVSDQEQKMREVLELIRVVIKDVNEGKIGSLKALGDIEYALEME